MNNIYPPDDLNEFDIAIIGMAGRFPGANNITEFWNNLQSGTESITFFSDKELADSGIEKSKLAESNYVKAAPVLAFPEYFDAAFFDYSPREATFMDPQHRIFLECAWETLESAGYRSEDNGPRIGVYAGTTINTYLMFSGLASFWDTDSLQVLIGNDKDFLATRISYKLNLKGPSITVQSACSTSLVAVHIACQSLLNQECDMALAGGVAVRVPHRVGYTYQEGNIVSPDGHCRAFDAKAKGTVFGSGVGIVLLKRLVDAVLDGDCIHAVIKGSAINNDGSLKAGFTAPSIDGQAEVVMEAQANAGVSADTITFIEAHGTGTVLGDPIEVAALTRAFRTHTDKKNFCVIGSVKTNVGHLDAAAGITGLIKTVLALKHKQIPPTLHFEKPNPKIDFENSPFYVNNALIEWNSNSSPHRAGVSSLGVGGTNAHIILEEAPTIPSSRKSRPWQLLPLSAKTHSALDKTTRNLVDFLKQNPNPNLSDVAFTLQVGRKDFDNRHMVVCRDINDAIEALESKKTGRVIKSRYDLIDRNVIFMFSGQGSQYINMGLGLYETEPIFRKKIDEYSEILKPLQFLDLRTILYPGNENTESAHELLKQTRYTQPALFAIELALANLWMYWGIMPHAMVGHSIGEYVAACLSGVFSVEDALSIIYYRGRLMQEMPEGSMLTIPLTEEEIQPYLNEKITLAVINTPTLCTVSGDNHSIDQLERHLQVNGIITHRLHTSHAFHSVMMEPMLKPFISKFKNISLNEPQIPFVSNVTGTWITSDEAIDPHYWARQLRNTVRFSACLDELFNTPDQIFLEIGPGRTLSTLTNQHPQKPNGVIALGSLRHPKESEPDVAYILNTLGRLWLSGKRINWHNIHANDKRQRISLPTYPFERKRYWFEPVDQKTNYPNIFKKPLSDQVQSNQNQVKPDQEIPESFLGTPRDEVERSIAAIWEGLLGVNNLSIYDNFFDIGGSSLIAVSLFAQINKTFGQNLPLATLFEAPTIEQLASILRNEDWIPPWTSLVEIQSGGSRPPFFFIHAAGGNVLIYRDLARRLGPDQPVYGFQAQGLNGNQPFLTKIEDMAALYVKELQDVHPEGPYLLGGYCMGGTVAFEMAQQLHKQGQEVKLVALFETYNWVNSPARSLVDTIYYYYQKLEFHLRNFFLLDAKGKRKFIQEKAKVVKSRSSVWYGMILTQLGRKAQKRSGHSVPLAQLWEINELAPFHYIPLEYPGRITDFRPVKGYAVNSCPEMGWENVAKGGVDTHILPFYPAGMMVEPFVEQLAKELRECIDEAL